MEVGVPDNKDNNNNNESLKKAFPREQSSFSGSDVFIVEAWSLLTLKILSC